MTDPENNGGYRLIAGAWVHPGARLGEGTVLEPGAVVGDQVVLGEACWLGAGAVVKGPSELGMRNRIYPGAVIGEGPQDIEYDGEPTRLEIGDDNVFREGVTINRGSVKGGGVTRIGSHNFLMVGSHVGHDCVVEDHVILANDVLIAGHCKVESHSNVGGGCAIVQFTTIGRHAFLGGLSGSTMDLEPFMVHDGTPAHIRGLNLVGLRRGEFSRRAINSLKEAYRLMFSESPGGPENLDTVRHELEAKDLLTEEAEELLDFMTRSREGKYGRMLQVRKSQS